MLKGTSRSKRKLAGRSMSRRKLTPEQREAEAQARRDAADAARAAAAARKQARADAAARRVHAALPSANAPIGAAQGSYGATCTADALGGYVFWTPRREVRVPTREAALRAMGSGVFGIWARKAAEPTPQGLHAFLSLVPRDHTTQKRWNLADHHWEWQSACFAHREVNLIAPIGHGKTEQLSYGRTAWEIGVDVRLRHILASNTAEQAIRTVRALRDLIDNSDDYRRVFPHVRRGALWTDRAFTIERPNMGDRNPTVQAVGLHGNVLGARAERACLDDMDDLESTWTADARRKAQEWTQTSILSRLSDGGRIRSVQTAWHPEDHAHSFRRMGMPTFIYRIRNPDGSYLWHPVWNPDREARMRRLLGETASARMLDSRPRTGDLSRFNEEWVRLSLANGEGRGFYDSVRADNGSLIVVGVDLAVGGGEDNDLAAFATVLVDHRGTRHLLNMESGRWSGPDIVNRIVQHSRRYPGAVIVVENNGAQDYIRQFAANDVASLIPYTTGRTKADPRFGIESLATEMSNGKWAFPCSTVSQGLPLAYHAHPEVQALVGELFDYTPGRHTGDRLMAMWFAREGITRGAGIVETVQLWRG